VLVDAPSTLPNVVLRKIDLFARLESNTYEEEIRRYASSTLPNVEIAHSRRIAQRQPRTGKYRDSSMQHTCSRYAAWDPHKVHGDALQPRSAARMETRRVQPETSLLLIKADQQTGFRPYLNVAWTLIHLGPTHETTRGTLDFSGTASSQLLFLLYYSQA